MYSLRPKTVSINQTFRVKINSLNFNSKQTIELGRSLEMLKVKMRNKKLSLQDECQTLLAKPLYLRILRLKNLQLSTSSAFLQNKEDRRKLLSLHKR